MLPSSSRSFETWFPCEPYVDAMKYAFATRLARRWVFFARYHQPPIDFSRSSCIKKKEDERIETRKNISIIEQFRVVIKLKLNNKLLIMKLRKKI